MPRKSPRPANVDIKNIMIADKNDPDTMPESSSVLLSSMPVAPPEKINRGDDRGRTEERTDRRENNRNRQWQRDIRLNDQSQNRAKRCSARRAKDVRIGKRIPQQRLKRRASHRQRRAYDNAEQNPRQADVDHDQVVVAGKRARPVKQNLQQDRQRARRGKRAQRPASARLPLPQTKSPQDKNN